MVVSISAVVLLGAVVFVLVRKAGLKVTHMVVCTLFGFYLSATAVAPEIRRFTAAVAKLANELTS